MSMLRWLLHDVLECITAPLGLQRYNFSQYDTYLDTSVTIRYIITYNWQAKKSCEDQTNHVFCPWVHKTVSADN